MLNCPPLLEKLVPERPVEEKIIIEPRYYALGCAVLLVSIFLRNECKS